MDTVLEVLKFLGLGFLAMWAIRLTCIGLFSPDPDIRRYSKGIEAVAVVVFGLILFLVTV